MSKDNVGTTKEEQKQLMVSAVGALSFLSHQAPSVNNNESQGANNANVRVGEEHKKLNKAEKTADADTGSSIKNTIPNKATASRTLDSRLPAVKSSSVFDRLYKSQTVASKSHTLSSRARLRPSTRAKLPNRNTSEKSIDVEKDLLNFNRMAISRSRKVSTPHKIQCGSKGRRNASVPSFSTPQPRQCKKRPASYQNAPHTAPSESSARRTFSTTPRSAKWVYEFSPRMKPLTKLYFVSKFHPGLGLEPVEPISLGYTFFQTFCEYETGGIDSEQIAKEIFIAFFKKDHSQGIRHWKLHKPVLGNNSKINNTGRGGTVYPITMNATYAWRNTYRVALVKGLVRFKGVQNKEIRVENFTYDLTGDL